MSGAGGHTAGRKRDDGQRIIEGLEEVLRWKRGEIAISVTLPGQPARMMTVDEYFEAEARLALSRATGAQTDE